MALIAYTFTGGKEHEVLVRPHGNSHPCQPYHKTVPSTLQQLKDAVKKENKPAKAILHSVVSKRGGLVGACSAGDLPRDQKQIYNIRQSEKAELCSNLHSHTGNSDVLYYLMEQSRKCYGDVQFVRDVKAVPEPMCVLATDTQLDWLVNFCTDPANFAILCIDPTFCIGDFNVTPIVFQHPMLDCVRYSSSSPVIHGPILVHQKKEFSSYHYFLSTLIGLKPELSLLQAFGSVGEESLVQALKANFPWAHQLRCFIHMCRNIKIKLQDLKISASVSSVILGDIHAGSDGSSFKEGLVDANDEVAFFTQLSDIKSKWEALEQVEEPKCF